MSNTDEGRWLEGLDELTERERRDAFHAMNEATCPEEAEAVWDAYGGGR